MTSPKALQLNIQQQNLIGIAIHPSSQAFSTPSPLNSSSYTYDFRTEFGDDIDNYYVGNGEDLSQIESNSKDFVFSFDSFVHMDEEVISSYLGEISRVLKSKGYCWIHHSNLSMGNDNNFKNIAGRSNMDLGKFKSLTFNRQLNVVSQELIKWDAEGNPDWLSDGLSLIQKQ